MKHLAVFLLACGITTLVSFASCQNRTIEPVAIEANDMCAFCRMSISEKRYAAELIDQDGEVSKFDDIGCMANFRKQKTNDGSIRATFVIDFERREWLKAEDAFYVRSPEFNRALRIKTARRFVKHEDGRIRQTRHREAQSLKHAARKLAHGFVGKTVEVKVRRRQCFIDAPLGKTPKAAIKPEHFTGS